MYEKDPAKVKKCCSLKDCILARTVVTDTLIAALVIFIAELVGVFFRKFHHDRVGHWEVLTKADSQICLEEQSNYRM